MEYHDTPIYKGSALRKKRSLMFIFCITLAIIGCFLAAYCTARHIDRSQATKQVMAGK